MKYAVLGAAGQLGRDLCPRLRGEVTALGRQHIDLSAPESIGPALKELHPDVVVNCAAYNLVDKAEADPAAAFAANALGVRALAAACRDLGVLLVHFSTDYVFGLEAGRTEPYTVSDAPGPVSVYGVSKLTGEYLVRASGVRHVLVRTCGLYGVWGSGGKGGNFVETMLRVAGQGKPLRVVTDQTCTPSYTVDVAEATVTLLASGREGLFHITNAGSCTWYEFARAIFETAGIRADLSAIRSAEYNAPARRPPYSVLDTAAMEAAGVPPLRPWREALAAYLSERTQKR